MEPGKPIVYGPGPTGNPEDKFRRTIATRYIPRFQVQYIAKVSVDYKPRDLLQGLMGRFDIDHLYGTKRFLMEVMLANWNVLFLLSGDFALTEERLLYRVNGKHVSDVDLDRNILGARAELIKDEVLQYLEDPLAQSRIPKPIITHVGKSKNPEVSLEEGALLSYEPSELMKAVVERISPKKAY